MDLDTTPMTKEELSAIEDFARAGANATVLLHNNVKSRPPLVATAIPVHSESHPTGEAALMHFHAIGLFVPAEHFDKVKAIMRKVSEELMQACQE